MSVRVMTAVWALELPDSEKLVLLALADSANDEGHCWPSMRSLVIKCSKSDRTIQASIKRLVDGGHLTRREVPGKGCNYTVHPGRGFAPETASPPKGTTQTPEAASDKPLRTTNTEAKASFTEICTQVSSTWNVVAKRCGFHQVRVMDASRKQSLRIRVKEHGLDTILEAIRKAGESAWLRGEGRDSKWRPNLDFILQPSSLRRLIEDAYGADDKPVRRVSAEQAREAELSTAALYDRLGRSDEADEIRRKWETPSIGSVASKILEGVTRQ